MSLLIRRITLAVLVASLAGGMLAVPASSMTGPVAHASKKKKKCKKKKKKKHKLAASAKKKKKKRKCKRASPTGTTLPGQATHPVPTQPAAVGGATTGGSTGGGGGGSTALQMNAVSVTDNPVLVGSSTFGQVTISGPAPSAGQPVSLQSDNPNVTVPPSVVVAADQTTASFPVDTAAGAQPGAILTAAIGSSSVTVPLSVVTAPSVSSVQLERKCFTGPDTFNSNRVTLDVPAPVNTVVDLSSGNASFLVPSTATVPSGSKIGTFTATTLVPIVPDVTVTATLGGSVADSASLYTTATYPDPPAVSGLSLQPDSLTAGGSSTGTVTLACEAPAGGTTVTLDSAPSGPTMPATVTVPAGELSAQFTISTSAGGEFTITATTTAGSQMATLHVADQPT
ncbi:MAG: hypothetical protein WBV53_14000 [Solirubrobacterales bacterium]